MTRARKGAASIALGLLGACALLTAAIASAREIVDDAQRQVELPPAPTRVFAAGAPAEILLYTLVPEMLVGRNHQPPPAALELMPMQWRSLPQIANLPERDDPRYDAELEALRPDLYVDYGTVDDDYVDALTAISARTGVAGVIFDGRLANVPSVYRRLGAALGVAERGERLGSVTQQILDKYRNALAGSVRVYLACSADGLRPCYDGQSAGDAAQWLGARNVAGELSTAPRRPWTIEEIRAAAPDVVVALDAERLRADAAWQTIPAVAAGRVLSPPTLPFNFGSRPPSVNRLPGLVWLAYVLPGRALDDGFYADLALLFRELYHVEPSDAELRAVVER